MNENNKFCRNCGCPLNNGDMFCKNCGATVNNEPINQNNVNSQQLNQQPLPMNNNIPKNQNNNTSNSWKNIIISLIIFALVGGGVYFFLNNRKESTTYKGSESGNNNYKENDNQNNQNNNQNENTGNEDLNNNNQTDSTKSVSFSGFTFKVPSTYNEKIEGSSLSFSDTTNSWYAQMQVIESDYDIIISNKGQVVSGIEAGGIKVNKYDEKSYHGIPCLVMEVESMGQPMVMGYVKVSSSKIFVTAVWNLYEKYDYDLFSDIVKVLSTGVK